METAKRYITLRGDNETVQLGKEIADKLIGGELIFLRGELGAGKTTLTRGIISGLGHQGLVKSPTFTIVEAYSHLTPPVYHFDLYRLAEIEELTLMGWRDYLDGIAVIIVEWPEKVGSYLPKANLEIQLTYDGSDKRQVVLQGLVSLVGTI